MNSREFIYYYRKLSKKKNQEVTLEEAVEDIRILVEAIAEAIVKDKEIKLKNKGKFVLLSKKNRVIGNIHTGKKMEITPKKAFKFIPSKKLDLTKCIGKE